MKRGLIIAYAVTVIVVLLPMMVGCSKEAQGMNQKTEVVKRGDLVVKINSSGNLESLLTVDVKSNVEGEVERLLVKEGDYVEKGQLLIQINDEQIREEMRQAEANVSAAQAQLEQAKRSLAIKEKQLEADIQQQLDAVAQAKINLNLAKSNTLQSIAQQETTIQSVKDSLEQDKIALRQAEISLKQAEITLSELEQAEATAKLDLENAKADLERTQKLYEQKFVPKKTLEDAQVAYANAQSRYDSAQKRVLSQKETIESQKETIAMRKNAIQTRERTLQFEEQNLELLKQTRAAQEEQALSQLKIAELRLKQLQENLQDEKDIARFSLASAQANLLRNESNLKNQKERLEWTKILAPMSGVVINLEIEEGEIVTSGRSAFSQSPPLMQIVDLAQMVVKTFINEVDMEKLAVGQRAEIRTRAYPDKVYRGEVREISPSGQARDNIIYFEVIIAVLDSPKELRPGMTADVDIIVLEKKNTLILPLDAVQTERGGRPGFAAGGGGPGAPAGEQSRPARGSASALKHYVMLVKEGESKTAENGVIEGIKTYVEVGDRNDMEIEILSGLKEGDRVLVQTAAPQGFNGQFGRPRR